VPEGGWGVFAGCGGSGAGGLSVQLFRVLCVLLFHCRCSKCALWGVFLWAVEAMEQVYLVCCELACVFLLLRGGYDGVQSWVCVCL
jgi:hypothetical protein